MTIIGNWHYVKVLHKLVNSIGFQKELGAWVVELFLVSRFQALPCPLALKMFIWRQPRQIKKKSGKAGILYNAVSKSFIVIEPKFAL